MMLPVSLFALRTDDSAAQINALRAGFGIGVCQIGIAARDKDLVAVLPGLVAFKLEITAPADTSAWVPPPVWWRPYLDPTINMPVPWGERITALMRPEDSALAAMLHHRKSSSLRHTSQSSRTGTLPCAARSSRFIHI